MRLDTEDVYHKLCDIEELLEKVFDKLLEPFKEYKCSNEKCDDKCIHGRPHKKNDHCDIECGEFGEEKKELYKCIEISKDEK